MSSAGPSTAAPSAAQSFKPLIAYFFEDEPDDRIGSISFGHKATFAFGVHTSKSNAQVSGLRFDVGTNETTYGVPFQAIERDDSRAWQDTLESARTSTTKLRNSFEKSYYNASIHLRRPGQRELIHSIGKNLGCDVVEITDKNQYQWETIKPAPHSVGVYPYGTELPSLPPAPMKTIICWSQGYRTAAVDDQYILQAGMGAALPKWDTTAADGRVITLLNGEEYRIIKPRSVRASQRSSEFALHTNPDQSEVQGFVEAMWGTGSPLQCYASGYIDERVVKQLVEERAKLFRNQLTSCLVLEVPFDETTNMVSGGLLTRIDLGDLWGTQ